MIRKTNVIRWGGVLLVAVLTACGGGNGGGVDAAGSAGASVNASTPTSGVPATPATGPIEPMTRTEAQGMDVSPFRSRTAENALVPSAVRLDALPPEQQKALNKAAVASAASSELSVPMKTGIGRAVAATATEDETRALLNWAPSARGGQIAALHFHSPDAKGLRLGVLVRSLPMAATFRFYAGSGATAFEVPGQEILATVQRNLDAGDTSDAARTYWSPDLGGEDVTMEIEVPAGIDPSGTQIAVPRLSHVFRKMRQRGDQQQRILGEAGTCQNDVACDPAYERQSRSVALMYFVDDGSVYACTGTLLNDRGSSGIPYFLSANHCVSNQTVASTVMTDWFFRASTCRSATVAPEEQLLTGGATLLYSSLKTDTSFMRLNALPPVGAIYAGSSAFPAELGTSVSGLHHPSSDLQKYNEGTLTGFLSCTSGTQSYSCMNTSSTFADYLQVRWNRGATESGSSGSGLFVKMNGNSYLVGQLRGGSSSCSNPGGSDSYGRFDLAYTASLATWLNAASSTRRTPIYRFYNAATNTHFYTLDIVERDRSIEKYGSTFIYEGIAFYAYGAYATNSNAVYRFYNRRTNSHFFTISAVERAQVMARYSWFADEGTAWYANLNAVPGSTSIYRFYNTVTGTHFYTVSAVERDMVQRSYPQFLFEGAGYHAWMAP